MLNRNERDLSAVCVLSLNYTTWNYSTLDLIFDLKGFLLDLDVVMSWLRMAGCEKTLVICLMEKSEVPDIVDDGKGSTRSH